jgi:ribosomal-protein-alanine acetyltransferase
MSLSIRRADLKDLDAILAIENASFDRDRFPRRNLLRLLKNPSAEVLIAEEGGKGLGYVLVLFRKDVSVARLYSIATAPATRGQGLGGRLIGAAAETARRRGADRLRLEVRASNIRAQQLYAREGFAIWKESAGYYADKETALHMEMRLAGPAGAQKVKIK